MGKKINYYDIHQRLVNDILVEICQIPNVRAWPNNTGVAKSLDDERFIRYGLRGSADISGILGPYGKRIEIEIKTGDASQSAQQKKFMEMILKHGGIYILARSVLDATDGIRAMVK